MANSEYMNPSGIADPSASGFTAVVKAGNTVYIAGMVAQGGSLADIVKTTTYVTGIEHGAAVRAVRNELFPSNPPTSTLLVVSELANPAYVVEIESIAVVG